MDFKRCRIPVVAMLLLILSAWVPAAAAAPAEKGAEGFIQSLADDAIALLNNKNDNLTDREDRFRTMLREQFMMDNIGRFAAGNYWREMSAQQQAEYQDLFSEWVLKTYARRLGGYSGERFRVLNSVPATRDDIFVRSEIEGGRNAVPVKCDWRVRPVDGNFKIVDVVVEGVSMAVTQKQEFGAILARDGVNGLIGMLRDRLAQMSASNG
ncbi:MAG: phospholipid-binding protein MlaC [Alphaproteobacteria bacterium]